MAGFPAAWVRSSFHLPGSFCQSGSLSEAATDVPFATVKAQPLDPDQQLGRSNDRQRNWQKALKTRMAAMSRANWIHALLVTLVVVIVLALVRLHGASGIG
jgi:hypothetical protein